MSDVSTDSSLDFDSKCSEGPDSCAVEEWCVGFVGEIFNARKLYRVYTDRSRRGRHQAVVLGVTGDRSTNDTLIEEFRGR